jgi:hypothetical protein
MTLTVSFNLFWNDSGGDFLTLEVDLFINKIAILIYCKLKSQTKSDLNLLHWTVKH